MNTATKTRRRWFGAICLASAIAMLIAGETVLKDRLQPLAFVSYWSACFILTALAACTAVFDASSLRAEQREKQRALIENALQEIEREKRSRQAKKG